MARPTQLPTLALPASIRRTMLALATFCALTTIAMRPTYAQTFTVLHDFTGHGDGGNPEAALTIDSGGNIYGTTSIGGVGYGLVYELRHRGSGWALTPLYDFQSGSDGSFPVGQVVFGPDGALYGTTLYGGGGPCRSGTGFLGCGTVFKLTPPATVCHTTSCPWTETVLYRFQNQPDAAYPFSKLTFDAAGNIYGSTEIGGAFLDGTVYELTPSNGGWSETILHSFDGADGNNPYSAVIFDAAGNLYGTTIWGGTGCSSPGCGVVYELSPTPSGWVETVLYSPAGWPNPGGTYGGVIFGPADTLFGATVYGGTNNEGAVYELSQRDGGWAATTIYSFSGQGDGPVASLVMDSSGNLYGTAVTDGSYGCGSVFKLIRSGGNWLFDDLYDFRASDGCYQSAPVVFDAAGNMYGTSYAGGTYTCFAGGGGCGTVWEITP